MNDTDEKLRKALGSRDTCDVVKTAFQAQLYDHEITVASIRIAADLILAAHAIGVAEGRDDGLDEGRRQGRSCQPMGEANDFWRVDVGGASLTVRGREAAKHLEAFVSEYARLKLDNYKLRFAPPPASATEDAR